MKIALITPFPPYRGGISKHSDNLYKELLKTTDVTILNFRRQYPSFIFPGKNQYLLETTNCKNENILRIIDSITSFI